MMWAQSKVEPRCTRRIAVLVVFVLPFLSGCANILTPGEQKRQDEEWKRTVEKQVKSLTHSQPPLFR